MDYLKIEENSEGIILILNGSVVSKSFSIFEAGKVIAVCFDQEDADAIVTALDFKDDPQAHNWIYAG